MFCGKPLLYAVVLVDREAGDGIVGKLPLMDQLRSGGYHPSGLEHAVFFGIIKNLKDQFSSR